MLILLRTNAFDCDSQPSYGGLQYGEDFAKWLVSRLPDWSVDWLGEEDWGWAVHARKGKHRYLFGIYGQETGDRNEHGALWKLLVDNKRDRSHWFTKLFIRYIPSKAEPEVATEILQVLRSDGRIHDVQVEPEA